MNVAVTVWYFGPQIGLLPSNYLAYATRRMTTTERKRLQMLLLHDLITNNGYVDNLALKREAGSRKEYSISRKVS